MIDSHAHVTFSHFDEDREKVVERAKNGGVQGWIEVGTDIEQSQKAIKFAQGNKMVWATVGVHPTDAESLTKASWKKLQELTQEKKVVAVGEVGIDLYRGGSLKKQAMSLKKFIALAVDNNLPVVFHVRSSEEVDAHDEVLKILASYSDSERPSGAMHSYSGTWEQAEKYLELGMYLSFTGVVTFKNAGVTAEVARLVPMNRILIETDCPLLTPEPFRGKRNEPVYVKLVAEKVAELKGVSIEDVRNVTVKNTKQLFGVSMIVSSFG
jgi:TatD DNase family protein